MAGDRNYNVDVEINAKDNTKGVFRQVGQEMKNVEGASGGLTSSFQKLAVGAALVYAGTKLVDFLHASYDAAVEDQLAVLRLDATLRKLGSTVTSNSPQIQEFVDKMVNLGYEGAVTQQALQRLISVSHDVSASIQLTKLAADLAASGYGDLQSNTEALTNLMNGRARQAAQAFGIDIRESATAAEVLAKIQERVTVTSEEMSASGLDSAVKLKTAWEEFKGFMGTAFMPAINAVLDGLTNVLHFMTGTAQTAKLWGAEMTRNFAKVGAVLQSLNPFDKEHFGLSNLKKDLANINAGVDSMEDDIIASFSKGSSAIKGQETNLSSFLNTFKVKSDGTTNSVKDDFTSLAKTVVDSLHDQEDAVDSLKTSLKDLADQTKKSLDEVESRYKDSVNDLAQNTRDRIKSIDEEIADERRNRQAGWRTRIADLEKQKAQENDTLKALLAEGADIQDESNKSALQKLKEQRDAEIAEIKKTAAEQRKIIEDEIKARQKFAEDLLSKVSSKGFLSAAVAEGGSFLGAIGAGPNLQQITFNFNGATAGDDGIKKIITQAIQVLNREATLRGVAGK